MNQQLEEKIVIVAGASSGMGRATAIAAARAGAGVVLVSRRRDALEQLAAQIETTGGTALVAAGDANDFAAMTDAVQLAEKRYGKIDALINSVGMNIRARALPQLSEKDWRRVVDNNLSAAFSLTRAVLPHFRARGDGLIIHIASAAVKKPDMSGVAYQAAKAGVVGLAHGTMEEERGNGIRVSVVFPGLTDTPMVEQRPTPVPPEFLARSLQPEDVASACISLVALPARAYVPELTLYPARL